MTTKEAEGKPVTAKHVRAARSRRMLPKPRKPKAEAPVPEPVIGGLVNMQIDMNTQTDVVPVDWSPVIGEPVQWDYHLQEVLDSIKLGIEEARRGEGRYLDDSDLATDDDE